jgi:hypothetical protein
VAHSTPTDQNASNAAIFVHSSAGHAAAVAAPRAAAVATKTMVATAIGGAQTTVNNQLKAVEATVTGMATMTATTTNENEGDGGGGRSLAAARRRWWWQRSIGSGGSAAAAPAALRRWRQRRQLGGGGGSAAAGLPIGTISSITSNRCSSSATVNNLKPLLPFFAMVQHDRERSMIEREGWSVDQRW